MKAAPETMEMARLLIWESPEPMILPSENGIRRCPRGYPANFRPVLLCSHAGRMSALGQKQTLQTVTPMSALPPKADIGTRSRHVRFVRKADSCSATILLLFDHLVGTGEQRR